MNKRRQAIADMVNQLGEVSLAQLKASFPEVSEVTLRTDLKYLDETQQLVRIHGGAKSIPNITGRINNFSARASLNHQEKVLIASKAAALIRPEDSIFITAGTTCAELAKQLPLCPLYLFTDGIGTLLEIPHHPEYSIEVFGGTFNVNTTRIYGPSVAREIEKLRFNLAFIGAPGFHPKYGFSCLTAYVADTLNQAIEHADKVVMLMDSSKVNYSVSPRVIPLEKIATLVTDGKLDPSIISEMESRGITVL